MCAGVCVCVCVCVSLCVCTVRDVLAALGPVSRPLVGKASGTHGSLPHAQSLLHGHAGPLPPDGPFSLPRHMSSVPAERSPLSHKFT